jgi:uncharacterized protein (TIGR02453 family)
MKSHIIDEELYPPFEGFPKEGINFLRKLKRNNNRVWFNAHKAEYEELVKLPMQSLIATLAIVLRDYAPEMEANPKRSMFRIYRDTRFSKDKTPYKTHVAAVFTPEGTTHDDAGLYLHIEPGEIYLGGGIYAPDSEQLRKIRRAIAHESDAFIDIVNNKDFIKSYGSVIGEKLTRVPQGFDRNHPLAEYLRMKQYYAGASLDEKFCYSSKFVDIIHSYFRKIQPLVHFLNTALHRNGG